MQRRSLQLGLKDRVVKGEISLRMQRSNSGCEKIRAGEVAITLRKAYQRLITSGGMLYDEWGLSGVRVPIVDRVSGGDSFAVCSYTP